MQVSAKLSEKKGGRSATVEFDFGENLQKSLELFGEDAVYAGFKASAKIDLQAFMRRLLEAENEDGTLKFEDAQIGIECKAFTPGTKTRETKSLMERMISLAGKMTPQEKEAFLAELNSVGEDED